MARRERTGRSSSRPCNSRPPARQRRTSARVSTGGKAKKTSLPAPCTGGKSPKTSLPTFCTGGKAKKPVYQHLAPVERAKKPVCRRLAPVERPKKPVCRRFAPVERPKKLVCRRFAPVETCLDELRRAPYAPSARRNGPPPRAAPASRASASGRDGWARRKAGTEGARKDRRKPSSHKSAGY